MKNCGNVNLKSKIGKILDLGCNNTNYLFYNSQKIILFLKVVEGLIAVLAEAYGAPTPPAAS